MTILIACGLKREARIMAAPGVIAVAGGGYAGRLEAALDAHAGAARAILSSGLCGALDPTLKVGDLVVGWLAPSTNVSDGDPSFTSPQGEEEARRSRAGEGDQGFQDSAAPPHPALRADLSPPGRGEEPGPSSEADEKLFTLLRARLPGARSGAVAGVDRIVATAAEKAALRASTGAVAADMESHVAARVARRHGLPFAILRVVSDAADQALPPAALIGMRPDGRMDLRAVLRSIARKPIQIPALVATGTNAERAFRALLRGHGRLRAGPGDLDAHLLDMV